MTQSLRERQDSCKSFVLWRVRRVKIWTACFQETTKSKPKKALVFDLTDEISKMVIVIHCMTGHFNPSYWQQCDQGKVQSWISFIYFRFSSKTSATTKWKFNSSTHSTLLHITFYPNITEPNTILFFTLTNKRTSHLSAYHILIQSGVSVLQGSLKGQMCLLSAAPCWIHSKIQRHTVMLQLLVDDRHLNASTVRFSSFLLFSPLSKEELLQ